MSAQRAERVVIELKRPYPMLLLGVLMFLGGGWFMIQRAQTNDRGLILNGIVPMGPDGADVFYVIIGVLSLAMGGLSVLATVGLMSRKEFRAVLGEKALVLPHGRLWRQGEDKVPYETILGVATHPPAKPTFVIIETKGGRRHLSTRYLPSEWPPSVFARAVVERWRAFREAAEGEPVDGNADRDPEAEEKS